jgi:four helix bundle protein
LVPPPPQDAHFARILLDGLFTSPSNKEFLRYLHIAIGSAFEVENHILLAERLECLDKDQAHAMVDNVIELKKMIASLMRKIRSVSNVK